jgi:hypothetical protein
MLHGTPAQFKIDRVAAVTVKTVLRRPASSDGLETCGSYQTSRLTGLDLHQSGIVTVSSGREAEDCWQNGAGQAAGSGQADHRLLALKVLDRLG